MIEITLKAKDLEDFGHNVEELTIDWFHTFLKREDTSKKVKRGLIQIIRDRIHREEGEGGKKWKSHGETTLMARRVKSALPGWRDVLDPSPRAFLSSKFKNFSYLDQGSFLEGEPTEDGYFFVTSFWYPSISMDISYPRVGFLRTEQYYAHEITRFSNKDITVRTARALTIPVTQSQAKSLEDYYEGRRKAGIVNIGGQDIVFRRYAAKGGANVGGERQFLYDPTEEELYTLFSKVFST